MEYLWDNFASNDGFLCETGMSQVICMIRQRQLQLFSHVARFPRPDPVSRAISAEIRPRGRLPVTWLQRIDVHYQELRIAGNAHAWHSSCRCRTVAAMTCQFGVCSHKESKNTVLPLKFEKFIWKSPYFCVELYSISI